MKKLFLLFFIFLSCESDPPVTPPAKNTVFISSTTQERFVIIRDQYGEQEITRGTVSRGVSNPDCGSPSDGCWVLYLKPGVYELTIQRYVPVSPGYVYKSVTIRDGCNKFDLDRMDQW